MAGMSVHGLTRRVDLFTLRLFLTVVEEQQVRRAALRENIAASAATKRIQDLEEIAGVRLFERNSSGVVPSPAGQVLARHVRLLFANLHEMRREINEFTEGVRGHVGISATSAIIVQFLAREIGEFTRNYPLVDIELQEDTNASVVSAVVSGDADIAMFIASDDIGYQALDVLDYRTDRLVAVVPCGHHLCARSSVTANDLLDETLIAISQTTTMMRQWRKAAQTLGRQMQPKYRVNTLDAARSLVEAGVGVTIQPECMLSLQDLESVAMVPLAEPWAHRRLCIGTKRDTPSSAATRALIRQLTERVPGSPDCRGERPLAAELDRAA
jgi:DNA-binding transcriptional LysR family regulator